MSLKSLKQDLSVDEEVLSVTRKELSLPLTAKKLSAVTQIVVKSVAAQNFFLKSFFGIRSILISKSPRSLRDQYVKEGLPVELSRLGLQDRQWKMSLEKAFETISSVRATTEETVREKVKGSQFTDKERHLIQYLLKRPELLQLIFNGEIRKAQEALLSQSVHTRFNSSLREALRGMNQKRVFVWLRRTYREALAQNQKPLIRKKRTYHLDPDMYSFIKTGERCYIAVASLEARKRILIPLTHKNLTEKDFLGNIKVVLRHDSKVEVHRSIHSRVKIPLRKTPENLPKLTAADKGFTDLLHCSSGQKYGMGYGAKMSGWSDSIQKTHSGRARMQSRVKELEKKVIQWGNSPDHSKELKQVKQKISRIQKNNLGIFKVSHKREFIKKEVQKEIGTAVNSLFRREPLEVLVLERLDFDGGSFYGKRTNRLLKTWHKGHLRAALVKNAKMNCVQLEEVNPAYTSQLCRACGAVDAKNRKGDQFDCVHCGHKDDANFAASLNIRDRFSDSEIGLYTPYTQVKEILIKRHRLSLTSQDLNVT
jgi:transposase